MDMKHCLLRRLLGLVPLLLGISFLSFVLIQLSPGDPAEVVIRVNDMTPTPELLAEVRTQLGLDRPFPERYLRWLADVLRGDLGMSYVNGRPVAGELARALPPTLMLAGTAAAITRLMTETDEERRKALYAEILGYVHDEGVYIPLTYSRTKAVHVRELKGVSFGVSQYEIPFEKMYF